MKACQVLGVRCHVSRGHGSLRLIRYFVHLAAWHLVPYLFRFKKIARHINKLCAWPLLPLSLIHSAGESESRASSVSLKRIKCVRAYSQCSCHSAASKSERRFFTGFCKLFLSSSDVRAPRALRTHSTCNARTAGRETGNSRIREAG